MFGLNSILRYSRSHIYHLSVSETNSFWLSASIPSSYMSFHRFRHMGYWVWGIKGYGWVKKGVVSLLLGVRGRCLAWIASWDILWVIYTIFLWAKGEFFEFEGPFHVDMWFLIDWEKWLLGARSKRDMDDWKRHNVGSIWS